MRKGPIILIDDDDDDQFLLRRMLKELNVRNQIRFFSNGQLAFEYLLVTDEQPFIILCDMNMPVMDGLELRRHIDGNEELKKRAIPFIFLTTDASSEPVNEAYKTTIQGFFKKSADYEVAKEQLNWIVGYWLHCVHPMNQAWS